MLLLSRIQAGNASNVANPLSTPPHVSHPSLGSTHPPPITTRVCAGLFAEVKKHPHSLVVTSTLNDGTRHGPVTIPMRKKELLDAARTGEFFSYVAGVAYKMLTDYQISGIVIDNYKRVVSCSASGNWNSVRRRVGVERSWLPWHGSRQVSIDVSACMTLIRERENNAMA